MQAWTKRAEASAMLRASTFWTAAVSLVWSSTSLSGGAPRLNPDIAPGGNFDLSRWELQEPTGVRGTPTTIPPAQLEGASGFQDAYFFTDPTDGSMTFWDPQNGATTTHSRYPRSELREMNAEGSAANWRSAGTHTLGATLK